MKNIEKILFLSFLWLPEKGEYQRRNTHRKELKDVSMGRR